MSTDPHPADWLHEARWGTFIHYLADSASCKDPTELTVDDWNRRVDSFDVDAYAARLAEFGCAYGFLTIGQNSGFYCAPNATYDAIVGRRPSRLSRRDLVADLAAACTARGIRLLVYFTAAAPANDPQAIAALRCTPPGDPGILGLPEDRCDAADRARTDPRLSAFQEHWQAVVREWSERWGRQVHGWWIDGCYAADRMYAHADAPNWQSFAADMKAGNPAAIVAFNPGVRTPVIRHGPVADYTAGEISNTLPTNGEEPCVLPVSRWVDGAQYHILTFLGGCWGRGEPRFTDELVRAYTRYVNSWGGAITWDHPVGPDGGVPAAFHRQLAAIAGA